MNIRPDSSNTLIWILTAASLAGFAAGIPAFKPFTEKKGSFPTSSGTGRVIAVLDFSPETWDEMAPVCVSVIKSLLEERNEIVVLSTDLCAAFWFDAFSEKFRVNDKSGESWSQIRWAGYMPGFPSSAIEIFREPYLVTGDSLFGREKVRYVIFSSGENFHHWIFFGWARYRPEAVYYTSSSFYPQAYLYKSSGQAECISQGIAFFEGREFSRRKASVSWFCVVFSVVMVSKIVFSGIGRFLHRGKI